MRASAGGLVCAWLALGTGCATYTDTTQAARDYAQAGDYPAAITELSDLLGVDAPDAQPEVVKGDDALVLLERGMLQQANGDYDNARRDLGLADKELELLDLTNTTAEDVASYFYSDDAGPYKISPVERLTLNALNLLNYLALGDLQGARVEAKRFQVMQTYLEDTDPEHAHGAIGAYLAGFVYEQLGEVDTALRYYDEVLAEGRFASLEEPVRRLASRGSYRGANVKKLLAEGDGPVEEGGGDLLVVIGLGRVPYKVPERMPIGAAVGIVGADVTGDLSVLERSALKVLIYPDLVPSQGVTHRARASVDGQPVASEAVTNLGAELIREYEEMKPKILAAAVTRMITRAAVAEGARLAGREAQGNAGAVLGVLAGLAAESILVAADKPDTRSWTLLPDRLLVSRERVPAGTHEVVVALGGPPGEQRVAQVEVPEDGYALVIVMPLH